MSARPSLAAIPGIHALRYTERFTERRLESLRAKGDPVSDAVIAELAAEGSLREIHNLLGTVRDRAAAGSERCRALLDACNDVPSWASFEAMERGQRLIASFPLHMGLSLFSGSLCGGAVFQKMALVTSMTGMLSGDSTRRLTETSALVVGMAFPGAIEPGGPAHEILMRVRLLHSALRHYLVESGRFSHPVEVPINQQDLAITLGLFGYLNVRSLARLGVTLREDDLHSYNLLWRYAGHVLGIDEELLPRDVYEQREFFFASLKHQGRPEKLTPATKIVLDNVARELTRGSKLLFPVAQTFLHQICRYLSGNDYVSGMQIADLGDDYVGIAAVRAIGRVQSAIHRFVPRGDAMLYRVGALGYRRFLADAKRYRDRRGTYRVRTVESAAYAPTPA
jgi:hypothetical protein